LEEVLKLSHYGKPLGLDYEQPAPGFENRGINDNYLGDGCSLKTLEHEVSPLEKGEFKAHPPVEAEAPPGFETKISKMAVGKDPLEVSECRGPEEVVPTPSFDILGHGTYGIINQLTVGKGDISMRLGEAKGQSDTGESYGQQTVEETTPGFKTNNDGQVPSATRPGEKD